MTLEAKDAGFLELHLLGGVSCFLGAFECLGCSFEVIGGVTIVVGVLLRLPEVSVSLTEEERRQRPFRLVQMFDCRADVAEEVTDNTQLEVDFLLLWPSGYGESLLKDIGDFFQGANLGTALCEAFAEPRHHTALEVFPFNQKCPQINKGF
jgi:hypothetical protein